MDKKHFSININIKNDTYKFFILTACLFMFP